MIPSHLFTRRRQLYVFFFTVPEIPPAEVSGGGGSSLNLLYQDTMRKMGIEPSRIKPTKTTFKGVIPGVEASCTGSVTLEVVFGSPDNFRSEELIFDIVPFCSGYHALLGRTTFAKFNAVLHYAYLKLKMPGPRGVITVNGNTKRSLFTQEHRFP